MQVRTLHKILRKLMDDGMSHKKVVIDKRTFTHPLEGDGVCYLEVDGHDTEYVLTADDDGGIKTTQDGRECGSTCLVLRGHNYPIDELFQSEAT